jgi:hypothetical protein
MNIIINRQGLLKVIKSLHIHLVIKRLTEMRKTLNDLYEEYKIKYNGKPKHRFSHFIRVISMVEHHRTYIRPKIEWWSNVL